MKAEIEEWRIRKILKLKDKIDPKPQYQRGGVWNLKKNQLLIDSILRGIDIPKIYLRATTEESIYDFEVADGQQRLRAIWDFFEDNYSLNECIINGSDYSHKSYSQLKIDKDFNYNLLNLKLTITIVNDATDDEIRLLFARLQMGSTLNQPELRNAIASNVGFAINMEVETSRFFLNSNIPSSRFKRQDYLAHVITLIHYNNSEDLKADLISKMYENLALNYSKLLFTKTHKILNWMYKVNSHCNWKIRNKWAFVDIYWLLYRFYKKIENINFNDFADEFIDFETERLLYNSNPEILLESEDPNIRNKDLYTYIQAFKYSGGLKDNIAIRARVIERIFLKHLILKN